MDKLIHVVAIIEQQQSKKEMERTILGFDLIMARLLYLSLAKDASLGYSYTLLVIKMALTIHINSMP